MAQDTIYEALKRRLGREPTSKEISDECLRIIREARYERATGQRDRYGRRRYAYE